MIRTLLLVTATAAAAAAKPVAAPKEELQLVQVVIRHGDRAATDRFATEDSEKVLFRGLGELSDEGIDHAHKQGLDFKKRYVDSGFIDSRFIPTQVRFRASSVSRVLMSAGSFSNGLFQKTAGGNVVVPPIYTKEYNDDPLLAPALDCENGWDDVIAAMNLTSNKNVAGTSLDFMENQMWNCKDVPAEKVDAIIAEYKIKEISLPAAYHRCAAVPAKEFMYQYVELLGGSGGHANELRLKRTVGMLTTELLGHMQSRIDCLNDEACLAKKNSQEKMRIYYSHDVNVLALSHVFNAIESFKGMTPAFSSALVFELWKHPTEGHKVKVFLKNGQDAPFLDTGMCKENCSFDAVKKMASKYAITEPIPCERS